MAPRCMYSPRGWNGGTQTRAGFWKTDRERALRILMDSKEGLNPTGELTVYLPGEIETDEIIPMKRQREARLGRGIEVARISERFRECGWKMCMNSFSLSILVQIRKNIRFYWSIYFYDKVKTNPKISGASID